MKNDLKLRIAEITNPDALLDGGDVLFTGRIRKFELQCQKKKKKKRSGGFQLGLINRSVQSQLKGQKPEILDLGRRGIVLSM